MTAVKRVPGWKGSAEPTTPRRGETGGHPVGVALNRGWVDMDSVVHTDWDDRLGSTRGPSDGRADLVARAVDYGGVEDIKRRPAGNACHANARWVLT